MRPLAAQPHGPAAEGASGGRRRGACPPRAWHTRARAPLSQRPARARAATRKARFGGPAAIALGGAPRAAPGQLAPATAAAAPPPKAQTPRADAQQQQEQQQAAAAPAGGDAPLTPRGAAAALGDGARGDEHLLPRVHVPLRQPPGAVPRAVAVQRAARLFASQDVRALVLAEAAATAAAGGPDARAALLEGAAPPADGFPLALKAFDDDAFETRAPREWVPADAARARPPARVAVAAPGGRGGTVWVPATVLDCDEGEGGARFLVQLAGGSGGQRQQEDGQQQEAEEEQQQQQQQQQQQRVWLPRVAVCFGAEDPAAYARRYAAALAARARARALMLYELTLDCMPTEGVPALSAEQAREHARRTTPRAALRAQRAAALRRVAACWAEAYPSPRPRPARAAAARSTASWGWRLTPRR